MSFLVQELSGPFSSALEMNLCLWQSGRDGRLFAELGCIFEKNLQYRPVKLIWKCSVFLVIETDGKSVL